MPIRSLIVAAAFSVAGNALALGALADDAKPFDSATRTAIQSVITRQLDAIQHDDAKTAETFATPALQTKFPDPTKFLDMVKTNYGALVHPKSTTFGDTEDSPHGPLQSVTIVAADGTVWKAIYSFEKVDGEWRISGCGIERDKDQQSI